MAKKVNLSPIQIIALGFAVIIVVGALLLMLPFATRDGSISFIDALFTTTSATCVTGLVVYDTFTKFTFFGQLIIISLIQIGGLGFITVALMIVVFSGKRIGLKSRTYLAEAVSSGQVGGVVRYTKMIIKGTLLIEGIAAVLLAVRFIPLLGVVEGIWYSIFHAISAFCNAGFDLFGRYGQFSSLTSFYNDAYINIIITSLVLVGGIGFFVWNDIKQNKFNWKKYGLHTKIMLVSTAILLVVPTVLFVITEYNGAYADLSFGEKILAAYFQTVTTRTAGFNTTDYTQYSPAGYALTILLMIIGAGAGSTGGGMKITTFVVAALAIKSYVVGMEDVNVFKRRIDRDTVRRCLCGSALYILLLLTGAFVIMLFQGAAVEVALFEATTALGTVGLSSGITSSLKLIPQITVICLMFIGRVGSISLAMAITRKSKLSKIKYPEEKVIAG